ncbi:MAG: NUDIX domain-containing protein [Alphaproteobacteria bacterium]|jgi:8-oxo-dGTP diphosphatase|nr:NUDIX domain-containing protein [Alphaproteobacteria bacterium]
MKHAFATLVLVKNQNKVLMVFKKRTFNGTYNLPGGHKHNYETFEECAIRECKEETGIIPQDLKRIGSLYFSFEGKDAFTDVQIFLAKNHKGKIIHEQEECNSYWIDRAEIPYDKMLPADKEFIPEIINEKENTFYKVHFNKDKSYKIEKLQNEISYTIDGNKSSSKLHNLYNG